VRLDTVGLDIDDAVAGGPEAGAMVKRVKEHLRSLPDRGLGYGMLRYLHPPGAAELSALPEPQIGFNYLGRFDITAAEELSAAYDPVMPLGVGLVINAITRDGPAGPRLTAHWMYASGVFSEPEVAALAEYWSAALAGLVHNARRPGSGGHTPSDMPLVSLDQAQLDALEARWRKA
jgi:non-ribosomal peptide synthase protein (TIGR01720 family)